MKVVAIFTNSNVVLFHLNPTNLFTQLYPVDIMSITSLSK